MIDLNALKQLIDAAPKPPVPTTAEKIITLEKTIGENQSLIDNLRTNPPTLTEEQIADAETPEKFKKGLEQLYRLRILSAESNLEKLKSDPADKFNIK